MKIYDVILIKKDKTVYDIQPVKFSKYRNILKNKEEVYFKEAEEGCVVTHISVNGETKKLAQPIGLVRFITQPRFKKGKLVIG